MAEPLLSVIVPTHRRPETLAVTLRCLAAATDGSAELIVVDNGGGPETAAVIQAAAATTALRTIRSDQALPMSDSWELGLDHARGAYVTVIGDDDALTADAVGYATYVIGQLKPAILTWEPWLFYWPTCADTRMAGFFGGIVGPDVIRLNLGLALDRYVEDPWVYPAGPGIYQAFVSRAVIEGVRSRFGRYFIDSIPDVSSTVVNLLECQATDAGVFALRRPLSIRGVSHRSFGQSFRNRDGGATERQRFLASEASAPGPIIDPAFGPGQGISAVMASAWLRLSRTLAATYPMPARYDPAQFVELTAVRMLGDLADDPAARDRVVAEVAEVATRHGLSLDIEACLADPALWVPRMQFTPQMAHDAANNVVRCCIDCRQNGVVDSFGAMQLAQLVTAQVLGPTG